MIMVRLGNYLEVLIETIQQMRIIMLTGMLYLHYIRFDTSNMTLSLNEWTNKIAHIYETFVSVDAVSYNDSEQQF